MSLFNRWLRSLARKNRPLVTNKRFKELNRFQPRAEALEDRRMLNGDDTFALSPDMGSGAFWSDTDNNSAATGEAGEPDHDGVSAPIQSIWWNWTPASGGQTTIHTFASDFDTVLAVYTGATVGGLTYVTSNDQANGGNQSLVSFFASAGTTYHIAVDGYIGDTGNIGITLLQGPANNDDFVSAFEMFGTSDSQLGDNFNATEEVGEPEHVPFASAPTHSVWWFWTAPSNGTTVVDTFGSNYDTCLAVYTGPDVGSLTGIGNNDDAGAGLQSEVTFAAVSGTTYYFAVDGFSSEQGDITINMNHGGGGGGPVNDNWIDAIELTGPLDSDTGTVVGATGEVGEPDHVSDGGVINSVWWFFTAPANGTVTIDTFTSDYDTLLAAYTGFSVDTLTEVASNDDAVGLQSQIVFAASAGTTYTIAVDGFDADVGNVVINLSFLPGGGPVNDNFADAFPLIGVSDSDTGSNVGSTGEVGEPNHDGVSDDGFGNMTSIWWVWTSVLGGTVTVDTFGSDFDTVLGVYTGITVDATTYVASNDQGMGGLSDQSDVTFAATLGTTYHIAVTGYFNGLTLATGNVVVNVNETAVPNNPPDSNPGGPYNVGEGGSVLLDGSASTDSDGTIISYEWDFDYDGFTFDVDAVGATPSFDASGIDGLALRTIGLRVTDDDLASDIDTTTVTIQNVAPTINSVNDDGPVNEASLVTVTVNATDPAGILDPLLYEFDFDNDLVYEVGPQASNSANHTYGDNGTFTVNVRVTDGDGGSTTSSTVVTVNNVDPTITNVADNGPVNEASSVTVTVTANDVAGVNDPLLYEFDFDNDLIFEVGPQASNSANHTFGDNGFFQVNVRVTDGDGGSDTDSTIVTVNNVAPTITSVANDGPVGETSNVTITVTATDPAGVNDPLMYEFDMDNNGTFEVGPQAFNSAVTTFDDNGNYTVNVRVTDGDLGVDNNSTIVTITNVVPTATIGGDTNGVPGQNRNFNATADDVSNADDAAGFIYTFDWDDGSADTVIAATANNGAGVTAQHIFTVAGTYDVTVTATDKDTGVSTVQTHTVTIANTQMQGSNLVIGGTANFNDKMKVSPNGTTVGAVKTVINKVKSTFAGVTRVIMFGQSGDDKLTATAKLTLPVSMYGGDGNDKLKGGGGNNVLVGGAGDDKITGGNVRDLLIGGAGIDSIKGKNGDDIVIGGFTGHDVNGTALNDIMAEWTSGNSYNDRRDHLQGTLSGGANGTTFLNATTVNDDAAADKLKGQKDTDWFFAQGTDTTDADVGVETVTAV